MWGPTAWFGFPSQPLTSSTTLGKLLASLSLSFVTNNNSTHIIALLYDCSKIVFIKYLAMGLIHEKHSIKFSFNKCPLMIPVSYI